MDKKMNEDYSNYCLLELMEQITELSDDCGAPKKAMEVGMVCVLSAELGRRLSITPLQAFLLSLFVNFYPDSNIETKDLAKHLSCSNLAIMACYADIKVLLSKHYLCEHKSKDGVNYCIPLDTIAAFRENHDVEPKDYSKLEPEDLFQEMNHLFIDYVDMNIEANELRDSLHTILNSNPQYTFCHQINEYNLDKDSWLMLLRACITYYYNSNATFDDDDLRHLFGMRLTTRMIRQLRDGSHPLITQRLFEPAGGEIANADEWSLTYSAANELMSELCPIRGERARKGVICANTITPKSLFYPTRTAQQISEVEDLLMPEKFNRVQESLIAHGMRKGFACLFYGAPGTGKTETVLQIARMTGRNIMQVDMSQMRDKYVGESEKNVKAIFTRYRRMCQDSNLTPILLLNEADALLSVRLTEMRGSVDQMANTMQNIILQEMENLDGILIATTNLTSNLDAAFDRRFLYKVEFLKPTAEESRHIWQAMLPSLDEENARTLATKYDFSGGQIENIARKQVVNNILHDTEELDMSLIKSACDQERLNRQNGERIRITGFC